MEVYSIDLYDYFKKEKKEGYVGKLTCYLHEETNEININRLRPAMLVLPGGGYSSVSAREGEPIALKYLSDGYNAFVLEYSVYPNCIHPTELQEAAMAMVYIRQNAQKLHVKEDNIASIGFSAGGHLCGMLGSLFNDESLDFLKESKSLVRPNAVLLIYPVVSINVNTHQGSFYSLCNSDTSLMAKLSLDNTVTSDASPAFIVGTQDDNAVPAINSLCLATIYDKVGAPYAIHMFTKGPHGLSLGNDLVYGNFANCNINVSSDYYKWYELSLGFLSDLGFSIKD